MSLQHILDLLYEDTIIPFGQWVLKTFPIEKFVNEVKDERLRVNLGGVKLSNPVILSSQYYDTRILEKIMQFGFGAVITKTITPYLRPGHPKVSVVRKGRGLINCNGFKNPGADVYKEDLARMKKNKPLIVSVAGDTPEEYGRLVETLSPYADLIETNISSPNTALVYGVNNNPEKAKEIFYRVRVATNKPIIVKLSPDFEDNNYRFIIPAAIENGIQIINFGNTRRVEEPRLSQGFGGLSGPDIYDNVVDNIRKIRREFGYVIQIIATGGVDTPEKAYRLLKDFHADAVSYFTAFTRIPSGLFLTNRINNYLLNHPRRG